ncbi:MAG: class I SAM-dependent methyltransferase [Gammaproteobacteria bacterium]|nr:class I SAM-dependent methyltransferase [Gammaproteobacteria bacterium]
MSAAAIKRLAERLKYTPLHPQWHTFREERACALAVGDVARGTVLDIGCGRQEIRASLPADCRYVGLDYYRTATEWYHSTPALFGDAQRLPIANGGADTVLLLDVLEHLPDPEACAGEMCRVLDGSGSAVVQVPFMYPVHDAPLDFGRWTEFGLRRLFEQAGFTVSECRPFLAAVETAAMLLGIALAQHVLAWLERRSPWALLGVALPPVVLALNLGSWLLGRVVEPDAMMPAGYRLVLRKT